MAHSDVADEFRAVARDLQIWGFPLVFAQRLRLRFTQPMDPDAPRPPTSAGARLNTIGHQRVLSDPSLRAGVAPNVDTPYSLAFLDLDSGDFRLRLPAFGDRYYSVQIAEADTVNVCAIGQRTHGSQLPELTIARMPVGSATDAGQAEDGIVGVRSRFVLIVVRILVSPAVDGDLEEVNRLQDEITLIGGTVGSGEPDTAEIALWNRERDDEISTPEDFLDSLSTAVAGLRSNDVPAWVHDGLVDLSTRVQRSSTDRDAVAQGLSEGYTAIREHVGRIGVVENGWATNVRGGEFGDDHLLRAAVAYSQIFVNPAEEALYPVCEVDSGGEQLTGAHEYSVIFPPGATPPVDYFWSLTVYHKAGLLVENEVGRYAFSNRTPGSCTESDGSLVIRLRSTRPDSDVNWLPVPAGDFRVMLRLYGPRAVGWSPPPIVKCGP